MGPYRVAACPRPLTGRRFAAQISIASRRGSASTGWVMRFINDFASDQEAAHDALEQGQNWVRATMRAPAH